MRLTAYEKNGTPLEGNVKIYFLFKITNGRALC